MQPQNDPRIRRRFPCTVNLASGYHTGLILNLSRRGMFVQTNLPARPGTLVDVNFHAPGRDDDIELQAAVVWRKRVSQRTLGVTRSGMGIKILGKPTGYQEILHSFIAPEKRQTQPDAAAPHPTEGHRVKSDASPRRPTQRYVIRLARAGGPRSRQVVIECESEEQARAQALGQSGEGWTILELTRH